MQFRGFAENLLGSKVKIKLIRYLLLAEAITSEREIAKLIDISHSAVNKALKDLQDLNLLSPLRVGNVMTWQLNKNSYAYKFLQQFAYEIKEYPQENLMKLINSYLNRPKVRKAIIYGSVAEGKELPSSDIDLFILVDDEKERKDIASSLSILSNICLQRYGNRFSPNIFTSKDYYNPNTKNRKFLENVKRGIVVIDK